MNKWAKLALFVAIAFVVFVLCDFLWVTFIDKGTFVFNPSNYLVETAALGIADYFVFVRGDDK